MADVELDQAAVTLRLVPDEPRFIPEGQPFPNSKAIEPTSEDKEDAKERSTPIRVSVWDQARTSIAQACACRRTDKSQRAYLLPVSGVAKIRDTFKNDRLRVVEDPLEELRSKPGGDGHCGIEGLDRANGQNRVEWRDMLDELLRHCTQIDDPALKSRR
ncbi:MAG: hypothetical protein JWM53_5999 [bacterium]|nr:hypothetical protein [bacterium]